jgi:hypothetical protein
MNPLASELPAAVRVAVLLAALEPGTPRHRVDSAMVLLGARAGAVGEALGAGLLRERGDRVEVVDDRLARALTQHATERERRTAHLALACVDLHRGPEGDAQDEFDRLSAVINDFGRGAQNAKTAREAH